MIDSHPPKDEGLPLMRRLRAFQADAAPWGTRVGRRTRYRLFALAFRGVLPLTIGTVLTGFAVQVYLFMTGAVTSSHQAHGISLVLGSLAALFFGLQLFRPEQRTGTFELLWLGFGSAGMLVSFRALVTGVGLAICALCWAAFGSWHTSAEFPLLGGAFMLWTTMLVVLSLCAWTQTFFREPLAGASLALAISIVWLALFRMEVSLLNPWINPFEAAATLAIGGGAFESRVPTGFVVVLNRLLMAFATAGFLVATSRRLNRLMAA